MTPPSDQPTRAQSQTMGIADRFRGTAVTAAAAWALLRQGGLRTPHQRSDGSPSSAQPLELPQPLVLA
jgi:hypothetical protein